MIIIIKIIINIKMRIKALNSKSKISNQNYKKIKKNKIEIQENKKKMN